MRRAMSLWFPTFAADLVRRRLNRRAAVSPDPRGPRDPLILLTYAVSTRELIAQCCHRAAALGIAPGLDLAQARALLPSGAEAHAEPHQPERDAEALLALARRMLRFSPIVALDPPDGLLLDTTGTEQVHRGEPRLIRSVSADMHRLGLRARVASAPTFACAWAMARFSPHDLSRVPPAQERRALTPLPIAGLNLDPPTITAFAELGITRIGEAMSLPRSSLAARFGPALLLRWDQALGLAAEPITPVRPRPTPRAELLFDGPTDHPESIQAAARRVLDDLLAELDRRQHGLRQLDIELLRPYAPSVRSGITLSRTARNPKHLWSLLRTRLERIDLSAGVEGIVLTAPRTARLRHAQAINETLDRPDDHAAPNPGASSELIDTLVERFGQDNVRLVDPVETHIPERAFRARSVLADPPREPAQISPAPRPTLLFPNPEPATALALTPDGPVLSLTWQRRQHQVIACIGPERISPEWWRWGTPNHEPSHAKPRRAPRFQPPPPERDYYAIQLDTGEWLWIFRHADTTRWFVHGQWA